MLNSKTVFILGAGASYEVGFPLGSGLKKTISSKLDFKTDDFGRLIQSGDHRILELLRQNYNSNLRPYINACRQISSGILLSDSIDDYINIHQHNEIIALCGKVAIVSSILEAEQNSSLYVNPDNVFNTIDFMSVENSWYSKFYRLLTKQLLKPDIQGVFENVTVINFNYDRSLEHYLTHALTVHYDIPNQDAGKLVDNLNIYRPYGTISKGYSFGLKSLPPVAEIISSIKTYTEQIDDTNGLKKVHEAMVDADTLVFLGMAFHPNNLALLRSDLNYSPKRVFATRSGISNSDLIIVARRILNMLGPNKEALESMLPESNKISEKIFFADKCTDLFDEYHLSLKEL